MTQGEFLFWKMRKMHFNMMLNAFEEDKYFLICKSSIKEKLRPAIKRPLLNIKVL